MHFFTEPNNGFMFFNNFWIIVYSPMEAKNKETYEAPTMLVVEVKTEGLVCASGWLQDYNRQDAEDW